MDLVRCMLMNIQERHRVMAKYRIPILKIIIVVISLEGIKIEVSGP